MLRRLLSAILLTSALLAGCASTHHDAPAAVAPAPGAPGVAGYDYHGPGTLFAGPALYEDPQNTPHPAYNWPTLSHPAVGADVPRWWRPINATALPNAITGLEHVTDTPGVDVGAGTALFGSLAVVPGYDSGGTPTVAGPSNAKTNPSSVVDISDPTHPKLLSQINTQLGPHRGAIILAYPTGRLVTVISTGSGLDVWDITDPTAPKPLPPVSIHSHKVGVVPGTPFVYNAASGGGGGAPESGDVVALAQGVTEMWDFSDPENIVRLPDFHNGYACHHIYFWNNVTQDKYRSICAGMQATQIIDTKDPKDPKVIVTVPFGSGGLAGNDKVGVAQASFSHYAGLSIDGTLLLVGDEHGGGTGPIGCAAAVDTPQGRVSLPIGAVWFYDVTDEHNPQLRGWVTESQLEKAGVQGAQASCTAHHGRLIPVPGRDVLAMSFYGAGVVVIDFTGLHGEGIHFPTVLAQWKDNSDTWETWYYQGYLFTGDLNRGMDVFKLT
jgi:hypothetical protein